MSISVSKKVELFANSVNCNLQSTLKLMTKKQLLVIKKCLKHNVTGIA